MSGLVLRRYAPFFPKRARATSRNRKLGSAMRYLRRLFRWPCLHRLQLELISDAVVKSLEMQNTGQVLQFLLRSSQGRMPTTWVLLTYRAESRTRWLHPVLSVDTGNGFSEESKFFLRRPLTVRVIDAAGKSLSPGQGTASSVGTTV